MNVAESIVSEQMKLYERLIKTVFTQYLGRDPELNDYARMSIRRETTLNWPPTPDAIRIDGTLIGHIKYETPGIGKIIISFTPVNETH